MKKLIMVLCTGLLASCGSKDETKKTEEKADPKQLMEADMAFSKMSAEKGIKEAFMFYAADSAIKLRNKEFPVIGKEAMKKMFEEDADPANTTLTWKPIKAEIAASNDIGYTWGNWKMRIDDSTTTDTKAFYGNYFTVWKKQTDGSWKFVLDGGNTTPDPATN